MVTGTRILGDWAGAWSGPSWVLQRYRSSSPLPYSRRQYLKNLINHLGTRVAHAAMHRPRRTTLHRSRLIMRRPRRTTRHGRLIMRRSRRTIRERQSTPRHRAPTMRHELAMRRTRVITAVARVRIARVVTRTRADKGTWTEGRRQRPSVVAAGPL